MNYLPEGRSDAEAAISGPPLVYPNDDPSTVGIALRRTFQRPTLPGKVTHVGNHLQKK